jgi:hypothetical protein
MKMLLSRQDILIYNGYIAELPFICYNSAKQISSDGCSSREQITGKVPEEPLELDERLESPTRTTNE